MRCCSFMFLSPWLWSTQRPYSHAPLESLRKESTRCTPWSIQRPCRAYSMVYSRTPRGALDRLYSRIQQGLLYGVLKGSTGSAHIWSTQEPHRVYTKTLQVGFLSTAHTYIARYRVLVYFIVIIEQGVDIHFGALYTEPKDSQQWSLKSKFI